MVASVLLVLAGLFVAFTSLGDLRTIGLVLVVLGAAFAAVNLFMRARMR